MDETQSLAEKRIAHAEAVAQQFEAMAARIRLNAADNFGGVFLLVPPANVGPTVEFLALSNQNAGNFWMTLKLFFDQAYQEVVTMEARQRSPY